MPNRRFTASDTFNTHRRTDDNWEVWSERASSAEAPREPLIANLSRDDAHRICSALNAFRGVGTGSIPNDKAMRLMVQLRDHELRRKNIIELLEVS